MTVYTVEILLPEDGDFDRAGETVRIDVADDEYILAAARDQDVWLPAFCQQGWCTSCAARLLDGTVDHTDAKRYYEVDAEENFVLTCVARPESDLRIRACEEAAMRRHRSDHNLPP